MLNIYGPQLIFSKIAVLIHGVATPMFVCAPKIKVLDPHPARSGVFRDKGQIMPIAALLWAVEPSHFS